MLELRSVYICKADLDTIVAGFLLLTKLPKHIVVTTKAPEEILSNPQILCLECGGSGRIWEHNFDHHDTDKYLPCAAEQAWNFLGQPSNFAQLIQYTAAIDTGKNYQHYDANSLSLSALLSGMMLIISDQKDRFIEGLRIIKCMLEKKLPPTDLTALCQEDPTLHQYALAKEKSHQALKSAAKNIIEQTICGLRVMCLKSPLPGIHGLLYSSGADISIAGDGQRWSISVHTQTLAACLQQILTTLNQYEQGWGGPVHGTIIGSPRDKKSILTLEDLFKICAADLEKFTKQ